MSSIGMFALFYSVTSSGNNEKSSSTNTMQSSRSTGIYSSSKELFQRFFLGHHAKTKSTLSEEAESGDEGSVNSWLREGANPNELDTYGCTPLLNASALGRLQAVKNLVQSGAEINKTGPFKYTALHAAAQNGHQEVVSYLLRNGADINSQNDDHDTPMHLSLRSHHIEIVYMLLRNGGNSRILGFSSKSCIEVARDLGFNDLTETLKNYNLSIGSHSFTAPSNLSS